MQETCPHCGAALDATPDPPSPPGRYRWGDRWVKYDYARIAARLGKAPDLQLAKEIGCHATTIKRMREGLGLPKYDRSDQLVPYLGRISDRKLARHFGVHARTVKKRREALGIPPIDQKSTRAQSRLRSYVEALDLQLNS